MLFQYSCVFLTLSVKWIKQTTNRKSGCICVSPTLRQALFVWAVDTLSRQVLSPLTSFSSSFHLHFQFDPTGLFVCSAAFSIKAEWEKKLKTFRHRQQEIILSSLLRKKITKNNSDDACVLPIKYEKHSFKKWNEVKTKIPLLSIYYLSFLFLFSL